LSFFFIQRAFVAQLVGQRLSNSTQSLIAVTKTVRAHGASQEHPCPSMSVDLAHPAAEKIVLVLEGTGDDKIRLNSSSLDHPLVILPDQGIEIVGIEKKVIVSRAVRSACWLNHGSTGMVEAGYGPATK
jgi:hypothetical protein